MQKPLTGPREDKICGIVNSRLRRARARICENVEKVRPSSLLHPACSIPVSAPLSENSIRYLVRQAFPLSFPRFRRENYIIRRKVSRSELYEEWFVRYESDVLKEATLSAADIEQ